MSFSLELAARCLAIVVGFGLVIFGFFYFVPNLEPTVGYVWMLSMAMVSLSNIPRVIKLLSGKQN